VFNEHNDCFIGTDALILLNDSWGNVYPNAMPYKHYKALAAYQIPSSKA